jgi:hypothetical protein
MLDKETIGMHSGDYMKPVSTHLGSLYTIKHAVPTVRAEIQRVKIVA